MFFQEIINNLINISYAVLIFICAYVSNMAFGIWYNIKKLREKFDWSKIRDSILKIVVFAVGLTLLCIAITALPAFADYVGWTIPEEYLEVFGDLVIVGVFLTVTCKYIAEAITKFKAILDASSAIQGNASENAGLAVKEKKEA